MSSFAQNSPQNRSKCCFQAKLCVWLELRPSQILLARRARVGEVHHVTRV